MMLIPLRAVPDQVVAVQLASQNCTLNIYQKNAAILVDSGSLYIDVYVNNSLIIGGVVCQNANRIVRDAYLGFIGDLAFYDTAPVTAFNPKTPFIGLGPQDPDYTGLGARFVLAYLTAADLAAAGLSG